MPARRPPRRVAADWWILRSPRARSRRVLRVVSATRALAIARGVRSRPRRRRRSRSRTRGARRASLRRGFAKRVGEGIGIDDCRKRGGSRPASPLPPGSPRPARRSPFAFARRAPVPELLRGRHLRARGGVAPNHGRKHRRGRARARRAETRSPRSTSARSPPPRRDDARFRRRPTPVPSARGFAGAAESASGANAERATSTGRGARRSRGGECAEARACRTRRCRAGCKGALPCHLRSTRWTSAIIRVLLGDFQRRRRRVSLIISTQRRFTFSFARGGVSVVRFASAVSPPLPRHHLPEYSR